MGCANFRCHSTSFRGGGGGPRGDPVSWGVILSSALQSWVDTASNRNEYQEYVLGGKGSRCFGPTNLTPSCADCLQICQSQTPGPLSALPILRFSLRKKAKKFRPIGKHGLYKAHTCHRYIQKGTLSTSIGNPFPPQESTEKSYGSFISWATVGHLTPVLCSWRLCLP